MVAKPLKGKYLKLEDVRVSYDERTDTIHLTSKDKDLPTGRGFHLALNKGKDAEYTLRTLLENEGLIPTEKSKVIPERLSFNDAIRIGEWDKFPLGLSANGNEAVWDSSASNNLFIAGHSGSGKSIILQNIFFHCLKHSQNWAFFGIDLKQVEFTRYLKYGGPVKTVATTLETALKTVTTIHDEMTKRYDIIERTGVMNYLTLGTDLAWMLMIDETAMLLLKSPNTSEGKAENLMKAEIADKLLKISQLGYAAGIHLVMATQRPDSTFTRFKNKFDAQLAAGRMSETASQVLLGDNSAAHLNAAIKGRGHFKQHGHGSDFQSYLSTLDWPYETGLISK